MDGLQVCPSAWAPFRFHVDWAHMQVEVSLRQLQDHATSPEMVMASLESLARLAWSDDEIREEVQALTRCSTQR